jgi:hypothetical protein
MILYWLVWYFIVKLQRHEITIKCYSTVTDFAKLRGWSTSVPLIIAT